LLPRIFPWIDFSEHTGAMFLCPPSFRLNRVSLLCTHSQRLNLKPKVAGINQNMLTRKDSKRFNTDLNNGLRSGHTLIEVMVAISVIGFMIVSLYAGFSSGFAVLRVARENLRATQVLAERMEVIRLVRWDDVQPGFIPTSFTAPFYANDLTNSAAGQFSYTGTVVVADAPISESYSNHLKMIQIKLSWVSGNITRTREMSTFVSKYGLQNYVY